VIMPCTLNVEQHINKLKSSILAHLHIHRLLPLVLRIKRMVQPAHFLFQIKGPPQINRHVSDFQALPYNQVYKKDFLGGLVCPFISI